MTFVRKNYPPGWKETIVPRIRARDGYCCTKCGARDRSRGYHAGGTWHEVTPPTPAKGHQLPLVPRRAKLKTIYLTTAHLDHGLHNHADENLASMCNRCHLNYDRASADARRQASRRHGAYAARLSPKQATLELYFT